MDRVTIEELGFSSRSEAVSFLKKLWNQEIDIYNGGLNGYLGKNV